MENNTNLLVTKNRLLSHRQVQKLQNQQTSLNSAIETSVKSLSEGVEEIKQEVWENIMCRKEEKPIDLESVISSAGSGNSSAIQQLC